MIRVLRAFGRARYVPSHFRRDIDEPTLYHATLNTSLLSFDHTAYLVARLMTDRSNQS
ncbi:MAG: hypothetical protein O3A75_01195 [Verrucomicrobia bacterium]|nr:hypothetical protein [Verrucomicrobiota bacterium]MDA1202913.1 hypothetical protein [Verrucomicrobiota bacterium]